jgi:hypothetical protein
MRQLGVSMGRDRLRKIWITLVYYFFDPISLNSDQKNLDLYPTRPI